MIMGPLVFFPLFFSLSFLLLLKSRIDDIVDGIVADGDNSADTTLAVVIDRQTFGLILRTEDVGNRLIIAGAVS